MSNKLVRVGVIGLGAIAERVHLPHFAAASGCRLQAVSSSRESAALAAQRRYAIEHSYGDWRELVSSERVDAVAICTPNDVHAEVALAALRFGKHVLVEKPIATRALDAERMVALARAKRRVLVVHHNLRFHPVAVSARRLLLRGVLGKVLGFEGVLSHRGPKGWSPRAAWFFDRARVGGGVLMDLGVHTFDLLRYLVAEEVRELAVTGVGAADHGGGTAEHHASCLLTLRGGAVGTISVSWRDMTYRNRWYLLGERAALELDFTGDGRVTLHGSRGAKAVAVADARSGRSAQQAFVDRVRGKAALGPAASASGRDGAGALELALAAMRSARTGASVRL